MIPREILKKIRQSELRTNRIVVRSAVRGCARIPKGFRPKAQGCDAGATLGIRPQNVFNRNAVADILFFRRVRRICRNPVGVGENFFPFTQGCEERTTLGQPSNIIPTPTGLWQPV